MKILIGITQEPANTKDFIFQHHGETGSFTEVGPFPSKLDALNWLVYLKSVIGDFEEVIPCLQSGKDAIWYGFTYEKKTKS